MAVFKELSSNDVRSSRSFLNQLIDVLQNDISGSSTRKTYQHFVTGGIGPGVTSSLFQTVFDQDFTLQTANPIFDVTVGVFESGSIVSNSKLGTDSTGKLLFPSTSLMMREKVNVHRQFSQVLLGDATSRFVAPFDSTTSTDKIDAAMFVCFRRLFARDKIKRETFAMKFFKKAVLVGTQDTGAGIRIPNLNRPLTGSIEIASATFIYTDVGSSNNRNFVAGGEVGSIVDSSDTTVSVGLMFYDRGIAVFDLAKITSGSQYMSGVIDGMSLGGTGFNAGQAIMGGGGKADAQAENKNATFIPDFLVSGSMNNILDHICGIRFHSGSLSAMTFQNVTTINSMLVFCRASADEFNYSSNPTYIDSSNKIVVIENGQEDSQQSFTMPTTLALYDANDNMLAVAKMSRPVEKSSERDLTIRVRLDF